jgi:hypothetical protein
MSDKLTPQKGGSIEFQHSLKKRSNLSQTKGIRGVGWNIFVFCKLRLITYEYEHLLINYQFIYINSNK